MDQPRPHSPRGIHALVAMCAAAALVSLAAVPGAASGGRGSLAPKVKAGGPAHAAPFVPPTGVARVDGNATPLGFCGGDDWEPEIATDLGYVYVVWTHFPGDPTCDPSSANPKRVYIQVSNDGGLTFGTSHVVSETVDGHDFPSQVDSVVAVDPVTHSVYVTFLAYDLEGFGTSVAVARSTDFGASFTATAANDPQCLSCDHPWPVARDGEVYVAYSGSGATHFVSHSSDGGVTWHEEMVLRASSVAFAEGAVMDAAGNAIVAWTDCKQMACRGNKTARYMVSKTVAGTTSTTFAPVARGPAGPICPYDPDCGFSFFGVQNDIAIDAAGTLYVAWQDGQNHRVAGSPPIVQISKSSDDGVTWTYVGRADDKSSSGCPRSNCYALFPRIEAGAAGHISVIWMDDRNGSPLNHENGWNVWYRTSTTGGLTWTGPSVQVSQFDPGRPESAPNGYLFPYGDYQGIALTPGPNSKAVMIWGEGWNYTGGAANPGHVIFRAIPA